MDWVWISEHSIKGIIISKYRSSLHRICFGERRVWRNGRKDIGARQTSQEISWLIFFVCFSLLLGNSSVLPHPVWEGRGEITMTKCDRVPVRRATSLNYLRPGGGPARPNIKSEGNNTLRIQFHACPLSCVVRFHNTPKTQWVVFTATYSSAFYISPSKRKNFIEWTVIEKLKRNSLSFSVGINLAVAWGADGASNIKVTNMCALTVLSSARWQTIEQEGGRLEKLTVEYCVVELTRLGQQTQLNWMTEGLKDSPVLVDFCRKESLTEPKSDRRWRKAWWSVSGGSLATQIHSSGSVTVTVLGLTARSQAAVSPSFTLSLLFTSFSWLEVSTASILTSGVRLSRG